MRAVSAGRSPSMPGMSIYGFLVRTSLPNLWTRLRDYLHVFVDRTGLLIAKFTSFLCAFIHLAEDILNHVFHCSLTCYDGNFQRVRKKPQVRRQSATLKIIVEVDSESDGKVSGWSGSTVLDIRLQLQRDWTVLMRYTPREGNSCTDLLVNFAVLPLFFKSLLS